MPWQTTRSQERLPLTIPHRLITRVEGKDPKVTLCPRLARRKAGAQKRGQSQPKAKSKAKAPGHNVEAVNLEIDWARVAHDESQVGIENYSVSFASTLPIDLRLLCPLIHTWLAHSIPPSILPFIHQRVQVKTACFLPSWIQAQRAAFCP